MQAATLEALEQADIPKPQARAIAHAVEIEMNVSCAQLATKADVQAAVQAAVQTLRTEIGGVRADLDTAVHALRLQMADLRAELIKWVFTVMLGQTAALFGGMYLLIKHVN